MAASKISICNAALGKIGAPPIASLDEDSKRASTCNVAYANALDVVLGEFSWPFALARASLARLAAAPLYGFAYTYQLPTDFISLDAVDGGMAVPYQIEGDAVLTDAEQFRMRYVRRVTDPNKFSPAFVDLFATRLAAELALPITRKSSDYEAMMTLYRTLLPEARDLVSGSQGATQAQTPYWTEGRG